jgi:hypothetical protein
MTSDDDTTDATPAGLSLEQETEKDDAYSPSSERETEERQAEPVPSGDDGVNALPGTGGPDDAGDVDVDDEAIRTKIAERDVDPSDRPVG